MITMNQTYGEGFTASHKVKLDLSFRLWMNSWNLDFFRTEVTRFRFYQTSDTSLKVYNTVTQVKDKRYKLELNNVANGSETAATNTATGVTTIQIAYLEKCTVYELVNTLAHEYCHTPEGGGYTHSYLGCWPWNKRKWSVPYGIGDITQRIAESLSPV